MPTRLPVKVIFAPERSPQEMANRQLRARLLQEGIEAIQGNVVGLKIISEDGRACAITVAGDSSVLSSLDRFLTESEIGTIDKEAFTARSVRAAIK
jgi:hypothetical protein